MNDFISAGWGWYVAIGTVLSILACALLLWFTIKARVPGDGGNTTGHVWDEDLVELNNPLPRWWMWLFILTIIFSCAYLVAYPGLGMYSGAFGWSSRQQLEAENKQATTELAPIYANYTSMDAMKLMQSAPAMGIGKRLFLNNCAQCHGADGKGAKGFPSLADKDWLWGGSFESVKESITKGRNGVMPALGVSVGSDDDVTNVAQYVLSLSGAPHDAARAAAGKPTFAVCAACHGPEGKGNVAMGAPNLADDIWLHGGGEKQIRALIVNGKNNAMPSQDRLLTPEQIHILAAYVLSLSAN